MATIEVSAMCEKYSIAPYDAIFGDPMALSVNLIFARTHWKHEHEQYEKRKRESKTK